MANDDNCHAGDERFSLVGLAWFLLRAESAASTKIEGRRAGPRRLLEAEVGCVAQLTAILDVVPYALRLLADVPSDH